ncbi:MAG: hypothetical protein A3F67_04325 [Verrucomicrobia bacterium RIFCSPHIGHO2_12_FULL_41_10]|nr:MAG: hypothetical protein A3F67_04325 [Verrucomicrobia bacterium RIFCSPHIGHO2_12_FULL_41_10]HLB34821.1 hypothetical protein [Chthoniobacterales bacterium]
MSLPFINFFEALTPWLMLLWLFQKIAKNRRYYQKGIFSLILLALLAAGILALPIHGLSIARWVTSFSSSFSIPLVGLLGVGIIEQSFSKRIFSSRNWTGAWFFGAAASLVLYPSALGLSRFDTYVWGWNFSPLMIGVALITVILLWQKNRFGILLLFSLASFHLHVQESTNLWDYLIDPIYAVIAILMVIKKINSKVKSRHCIFIL